MSTLHDLTAWFGGLWGQAVGTSSTAVDRLAAASVPAAGDGVESLAADSDPGRSTRRVDPCATVAGAVAATGLLSVPRRIRGRKRTAVAATQAHATAFAALGQRPHRGPPFVGTGVARRTLRIDAAELTVDRSSAHINP